MKLGRPRPKFFVKRLDLKFWRGRADFSTPVNQMQSISYIELFLETVGLVKNVLRPGLIFMRQYHHRIEEKDMNRIFVRVTALTGTAMLCAAPAIIDTDEGKMVAISGLALLIVQAVDVRAWNLVILNLASIAGYTFSLLGA